MAKLNDEDTKRIINNLNKMMIEKCFEETGADYVLVQRGNQLFPDIIKRDEVTKWLS